MLTIRKAEERGGGDYGWLRTRHTFSFNTYYDPKHTHFRALRVINDDVVQPGQGFGTHPHNDMEILTWVLEGGLAHRDSTGGGGVIRPGEIQRMSAGTGLTHSEFNASAEEPVHFYQMWIFPDRKGHTPSYEQRAYADAELRGQLRLVAGPAADEGGTVIHQDARLYVARLGPGDVVERAIEAGRHAWVQVVKGRAEVNGQALGEGDGAALSSEDRITIRGLAESEILVFDLA
jgi:redox-sensitive bicupin YhaK (pirin superfamily)